jgi:SET domain-containing protein
LKKRSCASAARRIKFRFISPDAGLFPRLVVDADRAGNETRFINDYRGIAETPNVQFRVVLDPTRPQVCVVALVAVPQGAELLADYGDAYWDRLRRIDADAAAAAARLE